MIDHVVVDKEKDLKKIEESCVDINFLYAMNSFTGGPCDFEINDGHISAVVLHCVKEVV
jgi:hypothetical protein